MVFRALNLDELAQQFSRAKPFPFVQIDDLLDVDLLGREFAREVVAGTSSLRRLTAALHSPAFLQMLSHITGIDNLLVDERMLGGGLHQTAAGNQLDVHVDFNYLPDVKLFRRLNLQLYLNQGWEESWGGKLGLWDRDVKVCHHSVAPILGRCVIFEISDHSFHGTTRVSCPPRLTSNSIALYYYTREAPAYFADDFHGRVLRSRPSELLKDKVLMPMQSMARRVKGMFWRPAPADPVATNGPGTGAVNGTTSGAVPGRPELATDAATEGLPSAAEPPVEVPAGPS
ncbi:MAG: 2OG-Fe(II) oxygenase [Planctomycetota bacterium]|jgi:hypothetical protein